MQRRTVIDVKMSLGRSFAVWILFVFLQFNSNEAVLKCHQCVSTADQTCASVQPEALLKDCPDNNNVTKCYTKVADNVVTRGCLKKDDNTTCNGDACAPCATDGCNKDAIKSCMICSTEEEEYEDCAVGERKSLIKYCKPKETKCMRYVNGKNQTVRSCAKEEEKCEQPKNCEISDNNNKLFPSGRLTCYQCENCSLANTTVTKTCRSYVAGDECYSSFNGARGCRSDENSKVNCKEPTSCDFCPATGCNTKVFEPLKCIKCQDCSADQSAAVSHSCTTPSLQCYAQIISNKVERGCLNERNASFGECTDANHCFPCNENGCNKLPIAINPTDEGFTCIRCRSDTEPKCYAKANELSGAHCDAVNETAAAEAGCFSGIWDGVTIRGCMISLEGPCNSESHCEACKGKNCNIKSAASVMSVSLVCMLAALLLFIAK